VAAIGKGRGVEGGGLVEPSALGGNMPSSSWNPVINKTGCGLQPVDRYRDLNALYILAAAVPFPPTRPSQALFKVGERGGV
jgi:hypothetical protein